MTIISHLPHTLQTKIHAVLTYRKLKCSVDFIVRKYHVSKASLMRWNKQYDGHEESLMNKSHRPHTKHPNSHTEIEDTKIKAILKRNSNIGLTELYTKLRKSINYTRHYSSLYRHLKSLGYYKNRVTPKKVYKPKKYHTPEFLGEKWQMDVKYVPRDCNANKQDDYRYYQYTVIDEASRQRFIYPYREQSSYSTCDFLIKAIKFFGYMPKILQTDNGLEFTIFSDTKKEHPLDILCVHLGIQHKTIKPRTPRHNGKVERSHRNDNDRFYKHLHFYNFEDLKIQMARYLKRSNNIGMTPLNYKSPNEQRKYLEEHNMINFL